MNSFRSTYVEHSNSLPPRSNISRADLVVGRSFQGPVSSQGQSRIYHDREILSRNLAPSPQVTCYSHSVARHTADQAPDSSLPKYRGGNQAQSQGVSSIRQEVASHEIPRSIPDLSGKTTMSAVAVSYDPRMEMGAPRSTYAWHNAPFFTHSGPESPLARITPSTVHGLETSPELLSHDISGVGHGSDISSMTPPPSGPRSLTSSPPRPILTPEQRELKRQRDQARRDSKTSVRVRRGMGSTSYPPGAPSPPMTMHDFSSSSPMPVYTTASAQISLLAEPVTTVAPSYMPAYSTSPLPDHGHPQMFSHYSPLPSNDYMGMNYPASFPPPPSTQSLSSQYGNRGSPMSESGVLYPVQPPVLPSGNPPTADAGHVRVVQSRPKPQCWEHGCNGRQFSTFSNLLRHQREKSGQAAKASCPNCGAEFTRTTVSQWVASSKGRIEG
ncbi:hypothetical protein GGS21DRAFT_492640 [Xylaria nigripes]|nr:hypothetical protein GGS21DRAFT_492640 [Xylaria nigripes]